MKFPCIMTNGNSVSFGHNVSYLHSSLHGLQQLGVPNTNSNHLISNELSYLNNSRNRSSAYLAKIKQALKAESYSMFNLTWKFRKNIFVVFVRLSESFSYFLKKKLFISFLVVNKPY